MALPVLPDTELFSHPEAHQSCHNLSPLLKKASQHPSSLPPRWLPARCLSRHVRGTAQGCWHAVGQDEAPGRPLAPGMLVPPPAGPVPRDQHPTHACWDPTTPWGNAPVVKVSLSPVPPPPPPSRVTSSKGTSGTLMDSQAPTSPTELPSQLRAPANPQPTGGTRVTAPSATPPGGCWGRTSPCQAVPAPIPVLPPPQTPVWVHGPAPGAGGCPSPAPLRSGCCWHVPVLRPPPPASHPAPSQHRAGGPTDTEILPGVPRDTHPAGTAGCRRGFDQTSENPQKIGVGFNTPPRPPRKEAPRFPPHHLTLHPPLQHAHPQHLLAASLGGSGHPPSRTLGIPPPGAASGPTSRRDASCSVQQPVGEKRAGCRTGGAPSPPACALVLLY